MAIVIEEQGPRVSFMKIAIWIVVVVTIVVSVYYVFFKRPTLVDIIVPPTFQNTQTLSTITLNPDELVQSYAFQALEQHIQVQAPTEVGREHPFLPFPFVVTSTQRGTRP